MAKRVDSSSATDREKSKITKFQAASKCIERRVLNPLNIMPSLNIYGSCPIFHEVEDERVETRKVCERTD